MAEFFNLDISLIDEDPEDQHQEERDIDEHGVPVDDSSEEGNLSDHSEFDIRKGRIAFGTRGSENRA